MKQCGTNVRHLVGSTVWSFQNVTNTALSLEKWGVLDRCDCVTYCMNSYVYSFRKFTGIRLICVKRVRKLLANIVR